MLRKIATVAAIISTVSTAQASCTLSMLGGLDGSRHFVFRQDEVLPHSNWDYIPMKQAIQRALEEMCPGERVHIHTHHCRLVNPHSAFSKACFAETHVGYWFVTNDLLGNVHLTYSRWD